MDNISDTTWKVGDELAFLCGHGVWKIQRIISISPSGRITCGNYILNPDLTVRGHSGYSSPHQACKVTPEIRQIVMRSRCIEFLKRYDYDKLTDEQLGKVMKAIKSD